MVVKHLIVFLPTSVTFCVGAETPHSEEVHRLSAALAVLFPVHLSSTVKLRSENASFLRCISSQKGQIQLESEDYNYTEA